MGKAFKKVLVGAAAAVAVFSIVVATRPASFTVSRSVVVQTPAEAPFALVNDLHRWTEWSPFDKGDPSLTKSYEGPASGAGASSSWKGDKMGEGRMKIARSDAQQRVDFELAFLEPMESNATASFTFVPAPGGGTQVTWSMVGHNNFVGKAFSLFVDCDKMLGGEFERGLADLKAAAEKDASRRADASPR